MHDDTTRFPLVGEPLAIDLANTIARHAGREVDLLSDERQLRDWLDEQRARLPRVDATKQLLAAVRGVRRPVRECLQAVRNGREPPGDAIAELNDAAAVAPAALAIELDPTRPPQRVTRRAGEAAEQIAAALAEAAIEFLTECDPGRLRECGSNDCVLLFYGADRRRRWCSNDTCGNRERVRRHYRRHRS